MRIFEKSVKIRNLSRQKRPATGMTERHTGR
jgi:hypothetical protein